MRVLLVEPAFRSKSKSAFVKAKKKQPEESLWYPPLGLLKLATFHRRRGDEVEFSYGCNAELDQTWDRIYITTLFTFQIQNILDTINFYKSHVVGNIESSIYVGGIAASLLPLEIQRATGIHPIEGLLKTAQQLGYLDDNTNIDLLPYDYELLAGYPYAIKDTYYGYTTRGCSNSCGWCGVPTLEPGGIVYSDIKPMILAMRGNENLGDKPKLKLMDNNVLASSSLKQIVSDLLTLGYGKNVFTETNPRRPRVVDFNQGLDATFVTKETMAQIGKLNLKPMRIAFDRLAERKVYIKAIRIAHKYGVCKFSNYMLYNFKDTPKDLYERLRINISINKAFRKKPSNTSLTIYSYPMRYAPIDSIESPLDLASEMAGPDQWTRRFIRSVEVMKGVAHGCISPTPALAIRAIGRTYNEFLLNLYTPEVILRNRDIYERKTYAPDQNPGTGELEAFRKYLRRLLKSRGAEFEVFHRIVTANRRKPIKEYLPFCPYLEMKKWLMYYLMDNSPKINNHNEGQSVKGQPVMPGSNPVDNKLFSE